MCSWLKKQIYYPFTFHPRYRNIQMEDYIVLFKDIFTLYLLLCLHQGPYSTSVANMLVV